jgi:hypothetical protein
VSIENLNGSKALRITDNSTAGAMPPYVVRRIDVPSDATKVTLDLSLRVQSLSGKQGPQIWLVDGLQESWASMSHPVQMYQRPFLGLEALPTFMAGIRRCVNGQDYVDTRFQPAIGTWYDVRIEANLATGANRLWAKPSTATTYTSYGSYAKD